MRSRRWRQWTGRFNRRDTGFLRTSLGRPLKMRIYVEEKRSSYCVAPIEHMLSILRCYITGWGVRPIDSTSETCNNLLRLKESKTCESRFISINLSSSFSIHSNKFRIITVRMKFVWFFGLNEDRHRSLNLNPAYSIGYHGDEVHGAGQQGENAQLVISTSKRTLFTNYLATYKAR